MEIGLPTLLTIIFVILKLTGAIAWSWWWVFSPLIIVFVFGLLVVAVAAIFSNGVRRALTRRYRR